MFGDRLKALRQEKKLTQEGLGKILNKTKNNISQYETGKREPDNDTLYRIAEYFNVSTDYLLDRTDIRESADYILNNSNESFTTKGLGSNAECNEDFPEEAKEEIEKFKEYIRYKYRKI